MNLKNNLKKILPATFRKVDNINDRIKDIELRKTPKAMLDYEVQLVEHCNLNCAKCSHFCPLCKEEYLDIKEYEKDVKRLSKLFNGEVNFIRLMGGEPLLHPQITEFLIITRKYFPDGIIDLDTNGVLVLSMKKDFFKTMSENKINLSITKYPIKLDLEKIQEKCLKEKINFRFFDCSKDRKFNLLPLDLEGRQCGEESFLTCYLANSCHTLKHGKMYTCSTIPHINHFNEFFNCDLKVTSKDYVDIYQVENGEEILEFLSKPVPFCRYCNVKKRKSNYDWEVSKKDIKEWTKND